MEENKQSSSANVDSIHVSCRVRPFNNREIKSNEIKIIDMVDNQVILQGEESRKKYRFQFDQCYWSFDDSQQYWGQEEIFNDIGKSMLTQAFKGFNVTLLCYGQTGSGKTFTTLGLIQRITADIFHRATKKLGDDSLEDLDDEGDKGKKSEKKVKTTVEFRMLEIYNDTVRDLLNPALENVQVKIINSEKGDTKDVFVSSPMQLVHTKCEVMRFIAQGNKIKRVAETQMNAKSSRSHTIFQYRISQPTGVGNKKRVSLVNICDLAGSESAKQAQTKGVRLREGAFINKSLSTLALIIDQLVSKQKNKKKKKKKDKKQFVSYRDSTLTSLLCQSLGGNAKTFMILNISPAKENYYQTKLALKFAYNTKKIKNKAVVNENSNVAIIKKLKAELRALKEQLGDGNDGNQESLRKQLEDNNSIRKELQVSIEEQERQTMELETLKQQLVTLAYAKKKQEARLQSLMQKKGQSVNVSIQTVVNLQSDIQFPDMSAHIESNHISIHSAQGSFTMENTVESVDYNSVSDETHSEGSETESDFDQFEELDPDVKEDDELFVPKHSYRGNLEVKPKIEPDGGDFVDYHTDDSSSDASSYDQFSVFEEVSEPKTDKDLKTKSKLQSNTESSSDNDSPNDDEQIDDANPVPSQNDSDEDVEVIRMETRIDDDSSDDEQKTAGKTVKLNEIGVAMNDSGVQNEVVMNDSGVQNEIMNNSDVQSQTSMTDSLEKACQTESVETQAIPLPVEIPPKPQCKTIETQTDITMDQPAYIQEEVQTLMARIQELQNEKENETLEKKPTPCTIL